MQSKGITVIVLATITKTLTRTSQPQLKLLELLYSLTFHLQMSSTAKKVTQETTYFANEAFKPLKSELRSQFEEFRKKKRIFFSFLTYVINHTLRRSIGQIKKTSKTAMIRPVRVLTIVLLGSLPFLLRTHLRKIGRLSIRGHRQSCFEAIRIEFGKAPAQKPRIPLQVQMFLATQSGLEKESYDCHQVLIQSRGCSNGIPKSPLRAPEMPDLNKVTKEESEFVIYLG